MHITQLLADSALGLIGGDVGMKVIEPESMKLYELELEATRQQEDRVRRDASLRASPLGRRPPSSGSNSPISR